MNSNPAICVWVSFFPLSFVYSKGTTVFCKTSFTESGCVIRIWMLRTTCMGYLSLGQSLLYSLIYYGCSYLYTGKTRKAKGTCLQVSCLFPGFLFVSCLPQSWLDYCSFFSLCHIPENLTTLSLPLGISQYLKRMSWIIWSHCFPKMAKICATDWYHHIVISNTLCPSLY